MANPLATVKDKFGDKAKLVAAVEAFTKDDLWLGRTNDGKGLARVSNAKLLRLHTIFTEVKAKFGTRDKLVAAVAELEKRTKDEGFKSRLAAWPVPRLWDAYRAAEKRAKPKTAAKKKAAPAAKAAPAKKAPAKKAASKSKKA